MGTILLTGMTAAQYSQSANQRALRYAGAIHDILTQAGHLVLWEPPSTRNTPEYYDKFDVVLVGIAPLMSVTSNHAYGALSIIEDLWGSGKLSLFFDVPKPSAITASLNSLCNNPDDLYKTFFANRPGYVQLTDTLRPSMDVVRKLAYEPWPTTLFPYLPWNSADVSESLPRAASQSTIGMNLDAILPVWISTSMSLDSHTRWVSEAPQSAWVRKVAKTLAHPIEPVQANRGWTDDQVALNIGKSIGLLVPTQKPHGAPWSFRVAQALALNKPVASEWRETNVLGAAWDVLPGAIESMSLREQSNLGLEQSKLYFGALPSPKQTTQNLETALGL